MPVKIRLQRKGRKKKPFYHIVAADTRAPRDGRYIERLGAYNPLTKPATIELDRDRAFYWLMKGAETTDTSRAILKVNGLFYRKHLQRGVAKGAMTQEEADKLYQEWVAKKEASFAKRKEETAAELEARRRRIFGEPPAKPQKEEEEATAEAEDAENAEEEKTEDAEAPAAEAEDTAKEEESKDEDA